jgi:hypothetical protein
MAQSRGGGGGYQEKGTDNLKCVEIEPGQSQTNVEPGLEKNSQICNHISLFLKIIFFIPLLTFKFNKKWLFVTHTIKFQERKGNR